MAGRNNTVWGLPEEKWREVTAFFLLLASLLLFLSLISYSLDQRWIGTLGSMVSRGAVFMLGRWVSYVLPFLVLLAAIHAFIGRRTPFHPFRKLVSALLILMALCGLLALPYVATGDPDYRELAFEAGGLLGNFLTSNHTYALKLVDFCGVAGAYVVCSGILLLGLMLSTDFLLLPLMRHGVAAAIGLARSIRVKRPEPVATLSFGRDHRQRVFPTIGGPSASRSNGSSSILSVSDSAEKSAEKSPSGQDAFDGFGPPVLNDAQARNGQERDEESSGEETEEASPEASKPAARSGKATATKEKEPPAAAMVQTELDFHAESYELPRADLFSPPPPTESAMDREEVLRISNELEQALNDFNISARVVAVTQGPVVTQYELQPAPGVKVARILNLENDIALILRAKSVRIQAPIPGKAAIGVEVPNRRVNPVYFRELIETEKFREHHSPLAFVLGKTISGEPVVCDLASMPHLLIAGTTGSGKSVCVNSVISSMLFRMPPDKVKFIMIDPKRVELNVYSDIPHLIAPVVNEPRQAASALLWAVQQMDERLQLFSDLRVRNIDGYNAIVTGKRKRSEGVGPQEELKYMPHIVIIIDELADLMLIAKKEVEDFVVRLAQMSRAAGIHMIIATQRPSVNVITGIIKANFPSRIAFQVSAKVDSRTILDTNGAETLLGQGDMLFSPGGKKPVRVQGAFISDQDVEHLTEYLRSQTPAAYEKEDFTTALDGSSEEEGSEGTGVNTPFGESIVAGDSPASAPAPPSRPAPGQVEFPSMQLKGDVDEDEVLYDRGLRLVLESKKPSVSMIQRRLKIGFARAGRLMDLMEERGVVGPYRGSKPRELLVEDPAEMLRRMDETDGGREQSPGSEV